MIRAVVTSVLGAALAACSAPATLTDLKVAERRERAGDVDGAAAAYRAAQVSCARVASPRHRRAACRDALLGEAEVLEHAGRADAAIAAYLAIPAKAPGDAETGAIATYRAGTLELAAGRARDAWTHLWAVVTRYPDEPTAGDAVRALLADGRGRDPRALATTLEGLRASLARTGVADNLLWTLADLAEHELADPRRARDLYDAIYRTYPKSGLRDDARWHAARLSRALGDPRGAADRLRGLLATREVALGPGSYFSIWLDDAQLELGKVLRDDLHDDAGAAAAFRRLSVDYPASILRDDALYELAVTLAHAGDRAGACAAVAALIAQAPDSKYVARAAALECR